MKEERGKTRVLAVVRHPVGGIRTYLKYTYGRLDKDRYAFTILTVKDREAALLREDLGGLDARVVELEGRHLLLYMACRIFLTLAEEKFDLLHSHGFTAGALSVVGNLLFGLPHIMTSHDVLRKEQFEGVRGRLKRKALAALFSRIDTIQSVSADARENLIAYLPSLKRACLVTIRNGIDPGPPGGASCPESANGPGPARGRELRRRLGMGDGDFLFGFMGRFMEQKGFVYLVDAVERVSRDLQFADRFRVVSMNDGAYMREYRALIEGRDLSRYFVFHGFVSDVRAVMCQIDALVMPSLWEAYGLLAAEALVAGCPVIASDCIGLREVTRHTPAITVKRADAGSLAGGLKQFMTHADSIREQALRFVPVARRRYDVTETARDLDALFTKTASSGRRP